MIGTTMSSKTPSILAWKNILTSQAQGDISAGEGTHHYGQTEYTAE